MSMVGSQASEESKQSELQCRHLCSYCGMCPKYVNKHNTTFVTCLFFYTISANFNALIPSFVELLYSSLWQEFILPLEKVFHRLQKFAEIMWKNELVRDVVLCFFII